jgi:hypothetical protein
MGQTVISFHLVDDNYQPGKTSTCTKLIPQTAEISKLFIGWRLSECAFPEHRAQKAEFYWSFDPVAFLRDLLEQEISFAQSPSARKPHTAWLGSLNT